MAREQKAGKVKEIEQSLAGSVAAILVDYRGLSVSDIGEVRQALADADARFAVVKNTLARLAVREAGLEGLERFLEGPTAVAFVRGDPVLGAKRLLEVARRLPVLEVKGGLAEGRVLSADDVRALAALESREAMLAKLAGLATMELGRTAWMLQALQARFLSVLEAFREKVPAEGDAGEISGNGGGA